MNDSLICPSGERWRNLLRGQVKLEEVEDLAQHLESCSTCSETINSFQEDDDFTKILLGGDSNQEYVVDRLIDRIKKWYSVAPIPNSNPLAQHSSEGRLKLPQNAKEMGRFGPYQLREQLGKGGMGVVFLAQHTQVSRLVALKILPPEHSPTRDRLARFRREADVVARLHHPNIVQLFEANEQEGRPYFAMEYVAGGTLAHLLQQRLLTAPEAAHLVMILARAMHYAHGQGVIHRDLKPSNVLLDARKTTSIQGDHSRDFCPFEPKLSDFGLAVEETNAEQLTQTGVTLGTPGYMAPEQIISPGSVGPTADIYGLGAILFECLTGRPPHKGTNPLQTLEQIRTQDPPPPRSLNRQIPRDLETICLKCLEKTPSRRYRDSSLLADDLQRFLIGLPVLARPVGLMGRLTKWARRRPGLALLSVLCGLSVLAMVAGCVAYERQLRDALKVTKDERDRADEESRLAIQNAKRADANYFEAREAVKKILYRTLDPRWNAVPRLQQLRREQVEDALKFFEQIANHQGEGVQVQQDIAWACLEAAQLQIMMGRTKEGLAGLSRAVELTEYLGREEPAQVGTLLLRANALVKLGALDVTGKSLGYLEKGVCVLEGLFAEQPNASGIKEQLAAAHVTLGGAYLNIKQQYSAGLRVLGRGVELSHQLLEEAPDDNNRRKLLARARINLCAAHRQLKQREQTRHQHALAESELERALARDPYDREIIDGLAVLRINGAYDLHAEGKRAQAIGYVLRNVFMLEQALKREPDDAGFRDRMFRTHGVAGTFLAEEGKAREAALAWEKVVGFAPPGKQTSYRMDLIDNWIKAGELDRATREAANAYQECTLSPSADIWKRLAERFDLLAESLAKSPTVPSKDREESVRNVRTQAQEARKKAKEMEKAKPETIK